MDDLLGELESAVDDVVGIDGSAFASLTLLHGHLLRHSGHLHHSMLRCAAPGAGLMFVNLPAATTLNCIFAVVSGSCRERDLTVRRLIGSGHRFFTLLL